MGLNPIEVPDKIWSRMAEGDRKKFPRKLRMTIAERERVRVKQLERKIHDQFTGFCRRHKIALWHSNPTRKSSIASGLPDFLLLKNGRGLLIEFKVPPNSISAEQARVFAQLESQGDHVHVITESQPGAAYHQATILTKEYYNLPEGLE